MNNYKAILFDLDGTLVDSAEELTKGINAVMAICMKAPFTKEEIARMIGKGAPVLLQRVCDARSICWTPATIKQMQRAYERAIQALPPSKDNFFAGALETIEEMRASGLYTALVTNKTEEMTKDFLRKYQIAHLFDRIVTPNERRRPKPSGDLLRGAMWDLGCERKACLMVGDSRNDALEARACTMDVVLVETGYNEGEPIAQWARENGFDNVQKDIPAVWQWLKQSRQ